MASFDGTDETIDSREVIERIQELIAEFTDTTDSDPADVMSVDDWAYGLEWEDAEELDALMELAEEGESLPDWEYGETLIHEDYFEVYVEELVRDRVERNGGDDAFHMRVHLGEIDPGLCRRDAEAFALPHIVGVGGGGDERLRGHAARVQAIAAHFAAFDEHRLRAHLRRARRDR